MTISIIVPIYNVEKELDRCVQSILHQTHQNIEIILVDDGSPDNCPAMCDQYAKMDSRVIVIHKENGGLSSARNAGLKAATGDFILFVDSDDYIELDSCERLLAGMMLDADFVVAGFKEVMPQKTIVRGIISAEEHFAYSSRDFAILAIQENNWHASACCKLYRRSFLVNNGLFYKEGILFEDTHIFLRTYFSANKVAYVPYAFYNYVVREGSIMQSKGLDKKADTIVEIYNEWMEQIRRLEDETYKRYLYGALIRFYLRSCRAFHIRTWRVKGINFSFAMKYALNPIEKMKILGFMYLKDIFLNM